jgi:hypothetical protein
MAYILCHILNSDDYLFELAYAYIIRLAKNPNTTISLIFEGVVHKDINLLERFVINSCASRAQFRAKPRRSAKRSAGQAWGSWGPRLPSGSSA